ncbi:hypothetical protein BU17DRAFT_72372 [Hysterangium stoloniferum]|nr:hypothetical protein BU17DRAFT_72372 [Hysterangium stoloniferum]
MYSKYLRIVLVGMLFCCFWVGFYPQIVRDARYLASLNDPVQHKADSELLINSLANDASALEKAEQLYFDTTQALIKQKSFTLSGSAGYSGEVLNLIPVHFAATAIAGLPLKTETTPRGIYMEHELQQMLRDVFAYIFFEVEAAKKMRAEHFAGLHTQELLGYIKTNVKNIRQTWYTSYRFYSPGCGTPNQVAPKTLVSYHEGQFRAPFFPFLLDCIHLIFTPGAKSRCSLMSYGPGAPPLSSQGPYDIMLLPASTLVGLFSHSSVTASISFSPCYTISLLPVSTLMGLSSRSCITASTSFSCLVKNHAVHPAVTSYGPGAPPLSLQGPYDVMLSGTPPIFFIPLYVGHQTKSLQSHSSLTMKPILELTPCLNTSWPVFPFMHDCIYLIFTPGAQSHCSLTSYGPGAPPLSLQGPYDVMLSGHFGIYSPPQH